MARGKTRRPRGRRSRRSPTPEHLPFTQRKAQTPSPAVPEWNENSDSDMTGSEFMPDDDMHSQSESDGAMDLDLSPDMDELSDLDEEYEELFESIEASDLEPGDDDTADSIDKLVKGVEARQEAVPGHLEADNPEAWFNGNLNPPEFYRQGIETMDIDEYRRKVYAQGTERLIVHAEQQWRSFCSHVLETKDSKSCFKRLNFETVYQFLQWYLSQRTGKGGRMKRRVASKGSLTTFWCCFRLAYERALYRKIDFKIDREVMHNALASLGTKFHLTHKKRENRSMTLDDLKLQIQTTLRTTEKGFKLGEQRILAALFLLLLAPQGSRPQSILELRFGDVNVLLRRDPLDPKGVPRLVVELSIAYTKRYLGAKAEKTFILPEIMFDPSLYLSPHVFLLAILFRHRAFYSDMLNDNPHYLSELKIDPNDSELPLCFKEEILNDYVFRQCKKTASGFTMSQEPITQATMSGWVKRIGKLLGFERSTICYSLRYMAGNNLDQHGTISEALRNLVMDHAPNSDTFQKHYLNRHVCADLWAIHRAQQPAQELIKEAISHGSSRSVRRPISLTQAQTDALKTNPQYIHLTQQIEAHAQGTPRRRELARRRKALLARLHAQKMEQVRQEWKRMQSKTDIDRQIQGQTFAPFNPRVARPVGPAQQRILDALSAPLINDIEAQFRRRTEAIRALLAYCDVEEPLPTKVQDARQAPPPPEAQLDPMECARQLRASTFGAVREVQRCFVCVAKALSLAVDDPRLPNLTRPWYSHGTLSRHFIKDHLDHWGGGAINECPICVPVVQIGDKMHFQSHAEACHGIKSEKRWTSKELK